MLERTFCHIPGVSPRIEALIWERGILSWDEFLAASESPLTPARAVAAGEELRRSRASLKADDVSYFGRLLPSREEWRLFSTFRHTAAYLDIETTGLGSPADHITTIALYDGRSVHHYVHGENLDDFSRDIRRYGLIVTYNGKRFDIPFIERTLGIAMPQPHIDLMHVLHSLGIKGGLKGCERQLGIARDGLEGVDGYFAVLLWRDYVESGRRASLETLLAYNCADAVNLETLLVIAHNRKVRLTPFGESHELPLPERPCIPFAADAATIDRLRRRYAAF